MDIHGIKVFETDMDKVKAELHPAQAAGAAQDACDIYKNGRPLLLAGALFLEFLHPAAANAILATVAIMDKACA